MAVDQPEALSLSEARGDVKVDDEKNPNLTMLSGTGIHGQQASSCVLSPKTKEDWESHKTMIRNLYIGLNLPLKDVMKTMEDHHHFTAT